MTKKLLDIKTDLYGKAEEIFFAEGMDVSRALAKLTKLVSKDLLIQEENAYKLSVAIMNKVSKQFSY